jgi:membrane protease subunit (stomatin/prohibitin family)
MGFWKSQLIDVIDWTEPRNGLLSYRFPVEGNEIKNGAQRTVGETQVALFVEEGRPADVFGAGLHTLSTENLPVLTALKSWPYGFKSPFKAEVHFFSLRQQLGHRHPRRRSEQVLPIPGGARVDRGGEEPGRSCGNRRRTRRRGQRRQGDEQRLLLQCGAPAQAEAQFCARCGNKI